ncbi:serine acetyltransferase [Micromonospora sp. NBC_01796]|uniref:serine acetyltransferase n=1 Tax=Micromonospora sp. NBC_01796 TaxID=2975987 RepID=UPI002DDB29CD|nr:serine acetyltransferase [Micromonospora sp. NBC_01796]WSA84354.1 serine acetyltransferase [Micromonospora sp. NBC_01796]
MSAEFALREALRRDFARNRDWLTRAVLLVFRYGQWASRRSGATRLLLALPHKVANLLLLRLAVGCDLPAQTTCGPGLRLHHAGRGVAIHRRAVLGADITLFHDVAIGQRDNTGEPILEDGVMVGVGARILGPVRLGAGARVGANAVVLDDVPAGGTALGPRATIRPASRTQPAPEGANAP